MCLVFADRVGELQQQKVQLELKLSRPDASQRELDLQIDTVVAKAKADAMIDNL